MTNTYLYLAHTTAPNNVNISPAYPRIPFTCQHVTTSTPLSHLPASTSFVLPFFPEVCTCPSLQSADLGSWVLPCSPMQKADMDPTGFYSASPQNPVKWRPHSLTCLTRSSCPVFCLSCESPSSFSPIIQSFRHARSQPLTLVLLGSCAGDSPSLLSLLIQLTLTVLRFQLHINFLMEIFPHFLKPRFYSPSNIIWECFVHNTFIYILISYLYTFNSLSLQLDCVLCER